MPIGDTRKTGFLFPSLSYGSNDGMEVEIPFYWNIAPEYDMTITPLYMQKRGNKLDADFRYLTDGWGQGEIKGEYMNSDKKYNDESRWGYQFKHEGIINKQWLVNLDYSKVSDIDYFRISALILVTEKMVSCFKKVKYNTVRISGMHHCEFVISKSYFKTRTNHTVCCLSWI